MTEACRHVGGGAKLVPPHTYTWLDTSTLTTQSDILIWKSVFFYAKCKQMATCWQLKYRSRKWADKEILFQGTLEQGSFNGGAIYTSGGDWLLSLPIPPSPLSTVSTLYLLQHLYPIPFPISDEPWLLLAPFLRIYFSAFCCRNAYYKKINHAKGDIIFSPAADIILLIGHPLKFFFGYSDAPRWGFYFIFSRPMSRFLSYFSLPMKEYGIQICFL